MNYRQLLEKKIDDLLSVLFYTNQNIQESKRSFVIHGLDPPEPEFDSVDELYMRPLTPYIEEFFTLADEELANIQEGAVGNCAVRTRSIVSLESEFKTTFLEMYILDQYENKLQRELQRLESSHGPTYSVEDRRYAEHSENDPDIPASYTPVPLEPDSEMQEAAEIIIQLSSSDRAPTEAVEPEADPTQSLSEDRIRTFQTIAHKIRTYINKVSVQIGRERRIQAVDELFTYMTSTSEIKEFLHTNTRFMNVVKSKLKEFYEDNLLEAACWYEELFETSIIEDL